MSNIHHVQHKSEAERKHHLTAATGGDIYTLYVKNDTVNNPQHATVWCNGVTINANYPLLNTWLVSPQVCGNGTSVSISWNMVYSVSLTNTVAKDGVTFITSPSVPVPLGSTVTCTIQDGVPIFSQPLPIDAKEQIQLVLPSGTDYSSWTVGFGMGTNTVVVHQAAAQTFTFVPTPSYQVALTNEDNTNKLVAESDLTDTTPVTFAPGQKLLGVEWTVTGSWTFYDPTKPSSLSTNDPTKTLTYTNGVSGNGLRLQKRTITTTTIEEYDSSCVPPLFEPITLIIVVATMSAIAIQQAIMNRKANISLDLKIFKFDIAINQDLIDVSDHQVSAAVVPQTGFNSSTQACITDLTAALTKENVFNGQPFSVKAM